MVIASPVEFAGSEKEIPAADEKARASKFLGGIAGGGITVLDSGGKATLLGVIDEVKKGVDVLYLICHGTIDEGQPKIVLEKPDGSLELVEAVELVRALQDLDTAPSLIVLASCQSAGTGDTEDALTALAPRLAGDAGVPAVVAMQGKVGMDTMAAFMPRFFDELSAHGQVDRAMAVARGEIARSFPDYWMPVLFMRLTDGRLWEERSH